MSIMAKLFNYKASLPRFKTKELMDVLNIQKGEVIADIGSGGGHFTFLFAKKVGPAGKVFACDSNTKLLDFIEKQAGKKQMMNIETVIINENNLELAEKSCDLIFLRNVFHHIENHELYFTNLKQFLKANGRLVVIDYRKPTKQNILSFPQHYAEEEFIREIMEKAGYILIETYDFLPEQNFNIFVCQGDGGIDT